MTNSNSNNNQAFFDLITTGFGFINKLEWLTPKNGSTYMIANICLLSGRSDNPNKVYISTTVKGQEAIDLLDQHISEINNSLSNKKPVMTRVELGDLSPDFYVNKKGETVAKLNARILKVSFLKVKDGNGQDKVLFSSSNQDDNNEGGNQEPQGGNQEVQNGNQEPQGGNQEVQNGNQEPQGGNQEVQNGNQEPQGGNQEFSQQTTNPATALTREQLLKEFEKFANSAGIDVSALSA